MDGVDIGDITEGSAVIKRTRLSRRASLFRVDATDVCPENTVETMDYSPEYKEKLIEECSQWRDIYEKLKNEHLALKNKPAVLVEPSFLQEHENYVAQAEHLNNLRKLLSVQHQHLIEIRNKKMAKLEYIVSENNKHINRHLNL